MNKTLIILAEYYPYAPGEFFLDDELEIISKQFERIIVFVNKKPADNYKRFIPHNTQIISYTEKPSLKDTIYGLSLLFSKTVKEELQVVKKHYNMSLFWKCFKIMFMELVRSHQLYHMLRNYIATHPIDLSNTIFYSYWHDYKALGLSFLKKRFPNATCIARAHGWDVFADRHAVPYLPFKTYIINNLNTTFSISDAGKIELLKQTNIGLDTKIDVSRLGKNNHRQPIIQKQQLGFTFCSCSNMIPLKRIHLIIDILKELKLQELRWIHIGDGILRKEIEQFAQKSIPHINVEFKGYISNEELLNLYASNYIDLFMNVSESEGIPVSIMEALSAGIPVVATNVGGSSEIVSQEVGFLVEKDFYIVEVAAMIEQFLCSSSPQIESTRLNAYNYWKQHYHAQKNYSEFAENITRLSNQIR